MKIRTKFVTNSSSSSFVIKLKGSNHKDVIKNKEDLGRYLLKEYSWRNGPTTIEGLIEEEGEWVEEKYNELLEMIESGNQLYVGEISSEDYIYDIKNILNVLGVEIEWIN